jgi:hypothetical protein
MRSSLFGFIDYYLNYLITILAEYLVLGEGEWNGVERKRSIPVAFFQIIFCGLDR